MQMCTDVSHSSSNPRMVRAEGVRVSIIVKKEYRALLKEYRALLKEYRALLKAYKALLRECGRMQCSWFQTHVKRDSCSRSLLQVSFIEFC